MLEIRQLLLSYTNILAMELMYTYRRGRPKKRSSTESQNRTSAHPDKKHGDRPTDRQTHFVARDF